MRPGQEKDCLATTFLVGLSQ